MPTPKSTPKTEDIFGSAESYDRSINWSARIAREVPVLIDLFGPPGEGGIVDAGCGTGHQACALASRGYRVIGADGSEEMLEIGRRTAEEKGVSVEFVHTLYANLNEKVGGGFDGLYCIGNALAAAGSRDASAEAVAQFAKCLRPGGRLFLQVLNFPLMRLEQPCIRGPRVSNVDGREYISVRQFHFAGDTVQVTSISVWNDRQVDFANQQTGIAGQKADSTGHGWKQHAHCGTLYPMTLDELRDWCASSGLTIESTFHSYAHEPFDPARSTDLILVARRK